MKIRNILLAAAAVALCAFQLGAQQNPIPKDKDRNAPLVNDDIVQMSSMNLPDALVISKIKSAKTVDFDTSPAGLKALSDVKVHDLVVQAMISRQDSGKVDLPPRSGDAAPAAAAAAATAAPTDPNDPMSPHDSGLYLLKDGKLILFDSGSFNGEKGTNPLKSMATSGFAKNKQKAVMKGAHSENQVSDPSPVFYFYMDKEDANAAFMQTSPNPKSPKDYELVKLEVTKAERQLELMESGMTGSNMNTISKFAVKFSYTKIAPGAFKITVDAPLVPGEYCFVQGGGAMGMMSANGRVFDFGVGGGK